MSARNPLTWKAAVLPLAALTAAFSVGISHFVGGSPKQEASVPAASGDDIFVGSGPTYAPGAVPAPAVQRQSGSSLDMFMQTNAGYSKEQPVKDEPKRAAKPRSKAELDEFMRQVRRDIRDEASAQQAPGAAPDAGGAMGRSGPMSLNNKAQAAAQAAVRTSAAPRLQPGGKSSMRRSPSTFAAGSPGAGTLHGLSPSRGMSATGGAGDTSESGGASSGYAGEYSDGGGRGLSAGEYGSHGGGGASSSASSTGSSGAREAAAEDKHLPAPVAYIWPRSLDFGDMSMYETASRQVIVMNVGDADLKLGKIENIDYESPFYLENNACSSRTLKPGAACTFRVRFAPRTVKQYSTAFEVPSNDEGELAYQSYVQFDGNAKYSPWTSWWFSRFGGAGALGTVNRLNLGMVPEGYTMSGTLRITNGSGRTWHAIKLDASKLPASFKLSSDNCSGTDLAPGRACSATVTFTPDAATNRKFAGAYYGQYLAVNPSTKSKTYSPRPHYPPLLLDSPVAAAPKGQLLVLGDYNEFLKRKLQLSSVTVQAESCAPFPVYGLARIQRYFFFK